MNKIIKIYGLYDPVENRCRYVGRTKLDLSVRLIDHLTVARHKQFKWAGKHVFYVSKNEKNKWIRSILRLGLKPVPILLAEVEPEYMDYWEGFFANLFKEEELVNNVPLVKKRNPVNPHKHLYFYEPEW